MGTAITTQETGEGTTNLESQIRRRIATWTRAVQAKDIDGVMSFYAPAVRMFDILPPLELGRDQVRGNWRTCFSSIDGPIGYEMRDLDVTGSGEIAFCHCLTRFSGKSTTGPMRLWLRTTLCLQRVDGQWFIMHEHDSVPIDMDTNEALLELEPERS